MLRLLIADSSDVFAESINKQLNSQFHILSCMDGDDALAAIRSFEPDILLIDLRLSGTDSLTLIRAVRNSGQNFRIIVTSGFLSECTVSMLQELNVSYLFLKPCDIGSIICTIREIASQIDTGIGWELDNEIDRLLFSLGFHMGRISYTCMFEALRMKYLDYNLATTKEVYPAIAKKHGSNANQVEKAIRDAIKCAWKVGNHKLWDLYFLPINGESQRPGNDEFLSRMAKALYCGKLKKLPIMKIAK